ncbi:dTDP-4-amino-4,6-dideoxygalactose transaminase [Candidatus Albibeggiatoa sp. nov. NOAA]|uniref:dTDP-4-amino-4,6-dideoxygalactose transaminase n=1 Tax=Candidatus Albibeggiatoa sp. nov. NOAA TaxID=3162724 RepID=UPI0032FA722D|nr:dTDP-4-amino-4,6-dideoxygalactose transaminase [Thiotrichaceae bacterium]
MRIPFGKPFIIGKELFNIARAVMNCHLSGDGQFTQQCHQWLQHHHQCQSAMLTHSCTAALEMSAILCDIKAGDEVIMPSFTFVSTANAFVLRGATPVFVDIRPDTLNIDETLIEAAITDKTKAIVPVHYAGVGCEMDTIMEIAKRYNLYVIEDAAQAILSEYQGQKLGSIGQLGCLSFHETKNVISGEGGALLINDEKMIERAEIIREKGTNRNQFFRGEVDKYTWVDIGSSYLASELIGAFLYAQLEHAQEITDARIHICQSYHQQLQPLQQTGYIQLPNQIGNGHLFYILTRTPQERTDLIAHLKQRDIHAVFHYIPLHSSPAGLQYGHTSGNMSVTNKVSETLLRLPVYYEMSLSEVNTVVEAIKQFYAER